jgi:membrane dipeptidase
MSVVILDRRALLAGAAAAGASAAGVSAAHGGDASAIYIADMHFHLFFMGPRPASSQPLGPNMAGGQATLVSWSLVGDVPWLTPGGGSFRQKGSPKTGEGAKWLREEMARVQGHLASQKIAQVRTADDVAKTVQGRPHVILSVEGATFADDGLKELEAAYQLGVRHLQLVHFIDNRIGDFQTEPAKHGGLTGYGREVVAECNRLGILIDLAHCTEQTVEQVLATTKKPVVWSHSSLQRGWFRWSSAAWTKRVLHASTARAIASGGGVVGVWALGSDVGTSVEAYTDRVLEIADTIGEAHVAFGTDMNALSQPAIRNFSDLRKVVQLMQARGVDTPRIRKIAIENYARVLTTAMQGRTA